MVENQSTIFEMLYQTFKITKPIRLITLFSGYDSQALALKYLGIEYEHYKTCEWAIKSIQALKDLHFGDDTKDYSKDLETSQIKEFLLNKGISSNYNDSMNKNQINRLNEKQARTIYNNIKATHNLVNIQQVKGKDLEIVDTDKYDYILTYSFPCQDLSLAGKGKGMSDTTTRSGMLWEVERILTECKEKPQVLLMENVPQVHGEGNKEDFNKWQLRLEELGYKNYWQDLIATDYGIPQTRNRCFMVSILGDYNYTFPKPIPLKLKLKDLLEDNVDEKYYLSEKGMEYICGNAINTNLKDMYDRNNAVLNRNNAYCLNTKIDRRAGDSNYILENYDEITIKDFIKIKNATKKGYLEAKEGDGIDLTQPNSETRRGRVQKGTMQTLDTMSGGNRQPLVRVGNKSLRETLEQNEINDTCYIDTYNRRIDKEKSGTITTGVSFRNNTFLAIKNATQKGYLEATDGDGIDLAQPNSETRRGRVQKEAIQTLTTQNNLGVVVKPKVLGGIGEKDSNNNTQWKQQNRVYDNNVGIAVTTCFNPNYVDNDLRIRKLTPKECFRLMGVKDEDYDKIAKNQSDSSLYHLAGDSIVVNVLMAIFKEMI